MTEKPPSPFMGLDKALLRPAQARPDLPDEAAPAEAAPPPIVEPSSDAPSRRRKPSQSESGQPTTRNGQSASQSTSRPASRPLNRPTDRPIDKVVDRPKAFYITTGLDRHLDEAVRYYQEHHGIRKVDRSVVLTAMLRDEANWTEEALDQLLDRVLGELTSRLTSR